MSLLEVQLKGTYSAILSAFIIVCKIFQILSQFISHFFISLYLTLVSADTSEFVVHMVTDINMKKSSVFLYITAITLTICFYLRFIQYKDSNFEVNTSNIFGIDTNTYFNEISNESLNNLLSQHQVLILSYSR